MKKHRLIDETELEDFKTILREHDYDEGDFEISSREDERDRPQPGEIYPITGTVTVTCQKAGVSRTYTAGHMSSWVSEFERDLREQKFHREWP